MIVTVTPNPALDVTYTVDRLLPGTSHRVSDVSARAGGKGVNVAQVLHALGLPVTVTGPVGGLTGAYVRQDLERAGLSHRLTSVEGDTRRTLCIVAAGDATVLNESGPVVSGPEWEELLDEVDQLLGAGADAVVGSGSLPAGVPPTAYADLVGMAHRHGIPAVVDAEGQPLLHAARAGADLVKPNRAEAETATGCHDPHAAALALRREGAAAVVVSLGVRGLQAVTADGDWWASPPVLLSGNPTGAGDAATAALVAGLVRDASWPELLRETVAMSSAAVGAPVAGAFDAATYERLLPAVDVTPHDPRLGC